MVIMGIDPGIAITGYGVVEKEGNRYRPLAYGCIYTEAGIDVNKRLEKIYGEMVELVSRYSPDEAAVESLFFNRNTTTAFTVAQARGVIILALSHSGLGYNEYTPLQVKQSVAGYGRADKKQVQYMIRSLLGLREIPKPDDAADALSIALCHGNYCRRNGGSRS